MLKKILKGEWTLEFDTDVLVRLTRQLTKYEVNSIPQAFRHIVLHGHTFKINIYMDDEIVELLCNIDNLEEIVNSYNINILSLTVNLPYVKLS